MTYDIDISYYVNDTQDKITIKASNKKWVIINTDGSLEECYSDESSKNNVEDNFNIAYTIALARYTKLEKITRL